MTKQEAMRIKHQQSVLMQLGFTMDEADSLRRISMTLRRWHELECGNERGCIERDEFSGIPQWRHASDTGKYCGVPVRDMETGALKRLAAIIGQRNGRPAIVDGRLNAAPSGKVEAYIQGDPRGAALYIIRPGDIPQGQTVDSCYSRGIVVY
jgi:hypothetical protein